MNAGWIIAAFIVIDTVLERLKHRRHALAQVLDADIVTVAVMAAKFFQKHYERALCVLRDGRTSRVPWPGALWQALPPRTA